jgi:hypothetical protein
MNCLNRINNFFYLFKKEKRKKRKKKKKAADEMAKTSIFSSPFGMTKVNKPDPFNHNYSRLEAIQGNSNRFKTSSFFFYFLTR